MRSPGEGRGPGLVARFAARATSGSVVLAVPVLAGSTGVLLVVALVALVALAVIGVVVWPAVWSNKKARRDAAGKVLDRIFRIR
jgi:hypothetical protein